MVGPEHSKGLKKDIDKVKIPVLQLILRLINQMSNIAVEASSTKCFFYYYFYPERINRLGGFDIP